MQNVMQSTVIGGAGFLIGGLSFLVAANSAWYTVPFFVITGVVALSWHKSHARARSRKAALDAYAEREIARFAARSGRLHTQPPIPSNS
jgi:hypothetical protein